MSLFHKSFVFGLAMLVVTSITQGSAYVASADRMSGGGDRLVANLIRNATFLEVTPEFTDLYIIETQDKGREILIYCNTAYCYKYRGQLVFFLTFQWYAARISALHFRHIRLRHIRSARCYLKRRR